jgi:hypothetical protein
VDGLAKASILDIDGVAVPSGVAPAAAYSVRLLDTAVGVPTYTGNCMRVREDGGNTEADIGFDGSGNLDTAAIASHCGSNNGFVRYWYDQSGNAQDAGQATAGSQPQIYNGTAVITENGKPALKFDGSNDTLDFAATWNANFYYSVFAVRQGTANIFIGCPDTNTYYADVGLTGATNYTLQNGFNGLNQTNDWTIYRKNGAAAFTAQASRSDYKTAFYDGNQVLMSFLTAGSPYALAQFTSLRIGGYTSGLNYNGVAQEFIMYQSTTSNQSSNASSIETDQNTYFSIY